jgi:hypothetical protein
MDLKKEIIDWFNGPQDYQEGILLLQEVTKKQKVLGKLIKRGDSRAATEKLKWELNKVAGLKKIPAPTAKRVIIETTGKKKGKVSAGKGKKEKTKVEAPPAEKVKLSLIGDKPIESYPGTIQRLVNEYSGLYMGRGISHKELIALGEGNETEVVEARRVLIEKIKVNSDRMELLNETFEEFEKSGTIPEEEKLWPEKKEEETGGSSAKSLAGIDVEKLKILKKNIQSSVTKDRNLLLYQAKTKGKKENPMPKGPKRTTLEKRIAKKDAEIVRIDQQIADLG